LAEGRDPFFFHFVVADPFAVEASLGLNASGPALVLLTRFFVPIIEGYVKCLRSIP
jgi:hypothetical protein